MAAEDGSFRGKRKSAVPWLPAATADNITAGPRHLFWNHRPPKKNIEMFPIEPPFECTPPIAPAAQRSQGF